MISGFGVEHMFLSICKLVNLKYLNINSEKLDHLKTKGMDWMLSKLANCTFLNSLFLAF